MNQDFHIFKSTVGTALKQLKDQQDNKRPSLLSDRSISRTP